MTQPADGPTVAPYQYDAQSPSGEPMRGTLEATSAADAQTRLASLHLRVLSVTPVPDPKPPRRPARSLGLDDFLSFNQQLAQLTSAGLPVESGLRLIAADMRSGHAWPPPPTPSPPTSKKASPSKTPSPRHASRFPALYGRMVEAGIQTANLPAMLFNLGRHLAMMQRLRRTLWARLLLPRRRLTRPRRRPALRLPIHPPPHGRHF